MSNVDFELPAGFPFGGSEEISEPGPGVPASWAHHPGDGGLRGRMRSRLDDVERRLVSLRFGVDGVGPLTLREVGARMGISRELAEAIETRAVVKLS